MRGFLIVLLSNNECQTVEDVNSSLPLGVGCVGPVFLEGLTYNQMQMTWI